MTDDRLLTTDYRSPIADDRHTTNHEERMNPLPTRSSCLLAAFVLMLGTTSCANKHLQPTTMQESLKLHARSQKVSTNSAPAEVQKELRWAPEKTALIVCDMWDDHWCRGAARRVVELAGPMNDVINNARARGVFI